jgi:hypothetical protein
LDTLSDAEFDWAKMNNVAGDSMSGSGYTYNPGAGKLTAGSYSNILLGSGIYYFSEITLGQGSTLDLVPGANVTIYITGDITLAQGSTVNNGGDPSDLLIYSKGTALQFDQDNKFYGAFYGPNAHIQYDQTTEVFGSLVGGTIRLDKDACFHYDRNLMKIKHGKTGEMLIIAWREL